jgi:PBSX family phage terminase large subunit
MLEAIRAELGPLFANDAQRRFMDSTSPELLYSGAMGAGKSRIVCEKVWHLAQEWPGATFGVFRKYAASLEATTLRTFELEVMEPHLIARRNRTERWFELTNGSRIYFMGLDPDPITGVPSKVGSLNLAAAYVDEAIELTLDDWIMLNGRLRDPHMPWHQIGAATNPAFPKHWLKQRFSGQEGREYLHATASDNTFLPDDYLVRLAGMPDNVTGKRLSQGLWVAAEGVIWTLPDDQVKGPGDRMFKTVVAGMDWGFVHAFACEVIGATGSGQLYVVDELYVKGRTLPEILPDLIRLRDKWGITTFYGDPSEPAYISECRSAGLSVMPATNDVLPGLDSVAAAIKDGMSVDPSCVGLLGEMPGYTWMTDRAGGLKEKPVEINDDACDALRYGVMALRRPIWQGASDVAVV